MAQFLDLQAKEDEKSGNETTEEGEEEATESDIGFIALENTPEKSREMSELEKMDAKLDKSRKKNPNLNPNVNLNRPTMINKHMIW